MSYFIRIYPAECEIDLSESVAPSQDANPCSSSSFCPVSELSGHFPGRAAVSLSLGSSLERSGDSVFLLEPSNEFAQAS